jgi:hypothetical protein
MAFNNHNQENLNNNTMKKISLFFLFTCLYLPHLFAQGTGGFFDLQSSKTKLMLEQIAGYETFLINLKKGYQTTENGLNAVHEMKGGTFDLHTAYFNSLQQVNPVVQSNPKSKAIAGMQQQISQVFTGEITWEQQQKIFAPAEINYINQVYLNIVKKCREDMNDLNQVLTPGKLQMTDHQRLERIDQLYATTQDKLAFSQSFATKCRQMANDRQRAKKNNDQLKTLYGIQ